MKIMILVEEEALANLRASSRGNTKRASVIQNDWA